jgi:hypothetical protein
LRRAGPQERHHVGRATERIRDRLAAVDGERGHEPAVDLGDQHFAGRGGGAVELGQSLNAVLVRWSGDPKHEARFGIISHSNFLSSIAGS